MDTAEEESDQEWNEAWDKDIMTESDVSGQAHAVVAAGGVRTSVCKQSAKADDNSLMSRLKLNDNKAGMEGLDRDKINQIIYEASKGSRYYENEVKKEEQVNRRIEEQMKRIPKLTEASIQQGVIIADKLLAELESSRDLSRTIVHIDMDAFFAAVEMRENPKLRNIPMAVGGNDMLSTSNYLARRFGVRAAMPGFIGKKLCPELVIVPASYDKYQAVSKDVRAILCQYDPNMCPMSLDEAYLDITEHLEKRKHLTEEQRTYRRMQMEEELCTCLENVKQKFTKAVVRSEQHTQNTLDDSCNNESVRCAACGKPKCVNEEIITFGISAEEAVKEMRFRIHAETRLTASAGIAPNMLLAKVCSDKNKPNGQYMIPPTRQAIFEFVRDLPIRKVSGIGKVTEKMLAALEVTTCMDLYNKRGLLYHLYSSISFNYFMRVCIGIGSTRVERDGERKSIGVERTFSEISKPAELYKKCYELCEALTEDLSKQHMMGKTVTLKLKLSNFEMHTRAHTLPHYINDMDSIYNAAKAILRHEIQGSAPAPLKLRLMGVRMTNLMSESEATKQKTISGLFKKIRTTTKSDVHNSLGAQSVQEHLGSGFREQPIAPTNKSNQDHLTTAGNEFDVHMNDVSNYALERSLQSDTVASAENSFAESTRDQKEVQQVKHQTALEVTADRLKQAHDLSEYPEIRHICSYDRSSDQQSKPSVFGYVSHAKNDYDQLNASAFWKECMTDAQLCGNCQQHKVKSVTAENIDDKKWKLTENVNSGDSDGIILAQVHNSVQIKEEHSIKDASEIIDCNLSADVCIKKSKSYEINVDGGKEVIDSARTDQSGQSEEGQKYECPICCKKFCFKSLDIFTEHIDECLAMKCVADEEKAINLPLSSHCNIVRSASESDKQTVEEVRDTRTNCQLQSSTDLEFCTPGRSTDYEDILICPVCNAPQRKSDMVLFNQHVDSCLNRQTIKEMVQELRYTNKRLPMANSVQTCSKKQKMDDKVINEKTSRSTILGFFKSQNR